MKRILIDEQTMDAMMDDTSDDPLGLVPADLRPLIPGFLERREKDVTELTTMVSKSDYAGIQAIGHRLKGTGVGYGFPLISEIGRELEDAAATQDGLKIRNSINQLSAMTTSLKGILSLKNSA